MLTSIEVVGPLVSSTSELTLQVQDATMDDIQLHGITGLEPVKTAVNVTQSATRRGGTFIGNTTGTRNIVLTVGLNPNWVDQSVSTLREKLYEYFMPEYEVLLRFYDDVRPRVAITGVVESMDPNIFSKDPEIQISIICPDPDFVGTDNVTVTAPTGDGSVFTDVVNPGNIACGADISIHKNISGGANYTGDVRLELNSNNIQEFKVDAVTINGSQHLEINTQQGQKTVAYNASGTFTDILDKVDADLNAWVQVPPGDSSFTVEGAASGQNWILTFFPRWGGL